MKIISRPLGRLVLGLVAACSCAPVAAESPAAAPAARPAAEASAEGEAKAPPHNQKALEQAFDGAMTCAALTAIKANDEPPATAWEWGNRSFAFAMLAVRFYTDATQKPLPHEEINNMLTEYANALIAMPEPERQPFEEGCGRKYADMDRLCAANACPHQAPGTEGDAPTPAATSASGAEPATKP